MRLIAYFLPQFHEIEENNIWWGQGFTEWDNVRSAVPLFKGHNQPVLPVKYYNLLDKKTVEWQTQLMNNNGIDGLCYYHYWFEGRKILEKPAENLLKWTDINQKFMFCWANHSWKKTWNGTKEILINQTYGEIDEWNLHITYLMDFFKDNRYIKIDNKPVLMLYTAKDIPDLDSRIEYYNEKCKEFGFDGIHVLESINSVNSTQVSSYSKGIVLREPSVSLSDMTRFNKLIKLVKSQFKKNYLYFPTKYSYKNITKISVRLAKSYKKNFRQESKTYLGIFTGWDSTPRHGRRGYIIDNVTESNFQSYLSDILSLSTTEDLVFINAWNEWAEGMFLEPTKNGINYLEIIKDVRKL